MDTCEVVLEVILKYPDSKYAVEQTSAVNFRAVKRYRWFLHAFPFVAHIF